jgi:hypothetical protein
VQIAGCAGCRLCRLRVAGLEFVRVPGCAVAGCEVVQVAGCAGCRLCRLQVVPVAGVNLKNLK